MRKVVTILLVVALSACTTHRVIQVDSGTKLKREGVFYYLPKTQIQIDITVKETKYLKGPFAQYSAKFTGISNVITENTTVSSVENIQIQNNSVADTSKLFYCYMRGLKNRSTFTLALNEYGCLTGVNPEPEIKSEGAANTGTGLGEQEELQSGSVGFEHVATGNTRIKTDTIFEKIILDTVTIEKQILQHSIIEKTIEDKAKDAADYLSLISENKMNLIAGYPEVDFNTETFNTMLGELNKMQQEYLNLFTGKTIDFTYHYRILIEPKPVNREQSNFLFRFDKTNGFSKTAEESDSLTEDCMYYYRLQPEMRAGNIERILHKEGKRINRGIACNIPEECILTIYKGTGEVVFETRVLVSQMGTVNYLPADLKQIQFNTESGSVKTIVR